jgi:putative transposase
MTDKKTNIHYRRPLRLRDYDYRQNNAYFITICICHSQSLLGSFKGEELSINQFGEILNKCWIELPSHYPDIELDVFTVMPTHVHGIVLFDSAGLREGLKPSPTDKKETTHCKTGKSLFEIVRAFKTFSGRRINEERNLIGTRVWQRGYYEHVIRNEADLAETREYIVHNPLKWFADHENPIQLILKS